MSQQEENFAQLSERVAQLTGMVENIARALSINNPPLPPQMAPPGSGSDIDPDFAINAGIPARREESQRGTRRSSLLQGLGPLLTPARAGPRPPTTQPPPDNTAAVKMVATEIKIKEEEKLTVVSIRSVRRLNRLYRAHKKDHKHSEHTLADFIKYSVLKEIRANEFALDTDLSAALVSVEDLKEVGDVKMLKALARYHRTHQITSKGSVATRIYKEVDRIKWPPTYRDNETNTWAINPEGFHLTVYSEVLEWTKDVREAVDFIYHGATQQELQFLLPQIAYGSRHEPQLIQMVMRGLGDLSESITTLISQGRLELIKDIGVWEDLLKSVFAGYAGQSRALAEQRAQATKSERVDDLWNKSRETERKSDREQRQPFVMPRARTPYQPQNDYRRGAVIHAYEEDDMQEDMGGMLALTESSIKEEGDSVYYSAHDLFFEAENEEEFFAITSGAQPKDTSGLPCFGDYEGGCKLGDACPFAKSHGNKELMKERTRRLVMQVLKSRYGGREIIGEIISEYQAKQNLQRSPANQDYRQGNSRWNNLKPVTSEIDRYPRSRDMVPPSRTLAPRPQDTSQPARTGGMAGMREGGDYGRGGGRLVTYGGRGNMGRAQYTNHLLQEDEQGQHDQVEEVMEGDVEESR